MNRILILLFLGWLYGWVTFRGFAQIPVMTFSEFEPWLNKNNDTTYIINFWATWCKPCVEELPHFERIHRDYQQRPVKVLLVSLDMVRHLETRLLPFLKQHQISSTVFLLNDPRSHLWIDKVDSGWSGSIPATLIYNRHRRKFYEKAFTFSELNAEIKKFLRH